MYAKLRVYLHEQMDVVGHDFHLYDVDVVFAADFLYEFLQAYIDTVDQDLAAVFWTPDYMILAGVHHIVIAFIFHGFIIPLNGIYHNPRKSCYEGTMCGLYPHA